MKGAITMAIAKVAKNHSRYEVYEANKSHKLTDRKTKGLRSPKSAPYRKPKYRLTAYEYDEF